MNTTRHCISLVIVALFSNCTNALALQGASTSPKSDAVAQLMDLYYHNRRENDKLKDEALEKAFKEYIISVIESEKLHEENRREVIFWTNLSAHITFAIAHIILILGAFAAIREWRHSQRLRKKGEKENIDLEIKMEGLAMRGVQSGYIILAVSLVFYFMYLKYVYPIVAI